MAKLSIVAGATSQTVNVFIQDSSSTTGAGLSGLVFNSSGLTAYYALPKAASVAITLATLSAVTSAYSSGGFKEIDATNMKGWYRFDIPDAAIASGRFSSIHLQGATNMAPCPLEIELTGWNNQDAVRGGMTALPNVASGSAGAIPTTGTGANQISVSSGQVILQTGTGTGQLDFTSGVVKSNLSQVLGGVCPATSVTGVPKVDVADWLGSAPNALVQGKLDAALNIRSGTAQAGAAGSITLDSGASSTTDFYKGAKIVLVSATGAGQVRFCSAYNGSTKVASIAPNWATNPDSTSVFIVAAWAGVDVESWLASAAPANTGDAYARIGAAGAGLTALGDSRIANLDATVSSRSTYAGGAVASVTNPVTVGTNNDKTGYSLAALDSAPLESGTAQAGAAGTITLRSGASATDSFYRGQEIEIYGGTGAGQARIVTGYVGSTKVATVDENWITNPDSTSTYRVKHRSPKQDASQQVTAGTVSDKTGYALTAGEHTSIASDAQTGLTAQGYTTARAGFLDTLNGLVAAIWAAATRTLTAFGFTPAVTVSDTTTLNAIADAMLDRANGVETSITLRQAQRVQLAAAAGKLSGAATTTVTIRDTADSKNRISATVDSNGNRSSVTLDLT